MEDQKGQRGECNVQLYVCGYCVLVCVLNMSFVYCVVTEECVQFQLTEYLAQNNITYQIVLLCSFYMPLANVPVI